MKNFIFLDETKFLYSLKRPAKVTVQRQLTINVLCLVLLFFNCCFLNPDLTFAARNQASSTSFSGPPETENVEINAVIWLYLEGAAGSPTDGQDYTLPMRTSLNDLRMLPGQAYTSLSGTVVYSPAGQPYNQAPWFYGGNEGDGYDSFGSPDPGTANYPASVVDWVLVSLRDAPDGMNISRKAALLHSDGYVEFVGGGFLMDAGDLLDSYYIVVEHRNHLLIMTPQAVPLVNNTLTYDFRNAQSYIDSPYGINGNGQKELLPDLPGIFAMYSGNGDQTQSPASGKDINFDDRMFWEEHNMASGHYCSGDYNLNGDCNYNDLTIFELNNGKYSSVP